MKYLITATLMFYSLLSIAAESKFEAGSYIAGDFFTTATQDFSGRVTGSTGYLSLSPFRVWYKEEYGAFSWGTEMLKYSSMTEYTSTAAETAIVGRDVYYKHKNGAQDYYIFFQQVETTLRMKCDGATPKAEKRSGHLGVKIFGQTISNPEQRINESFDLVVNGQLHGRVVLNEEIIERKGNYLKYVRNAAHLYIYGPDAHESIIGRVEGYAFCPSK